MRMITDDNYRNVDSGEWLAAIRVQGCKMKDYDSQTVGRKMRSNKGAKTAQSSLLAAKGGAYVNLDANPGAPLDRPWIEFTSS